MRITPMLPEMRYVGIAGEQREGEMQQLKPFDRFDHSGVKQYLEMIKVEFEKRGCESGSSGDGEITIRRDQLTAYVRRYRRPRDGNDWRVQFWTKAHRDDQAKYFRSLDQVMNHLKNIGL